MQEERKPIKGYEAHYEITSSGKIFSLKRKRTIKDAEMNMGSTLLNYQKMGKQRITKFMIYGGKPFQDYLKVNLKEQRQ